MNCQLAIVAAALAGCLLPAAASAQSPVTFTRDVATVLLTRCAPCHRPGQSAPFSLLSYEDARPRARRIAEVVASRMMPPWKPVPGFGEFHGERRLSDGEIAVIQQWVRDGMLKGGDADLPSIPQWPDRWQLGEPDLVVSMPEPYVLPARSRDVFRTFVISIPARAAAFVKAVEFRPGNPRVVHHANIKIDRTRLSRRRDDDEAGPGYEGGGSREARFPDGVFLGWTPGQSPRVLPSDMSWRLEPASDLVVELHLMPGDQPEPVQVSVGLFFGNQPPARTAFMLRLGRQDIDIAPGDREYVNRDTYRLPVDVEAIAVQPHAHYLAQSIRAWATLPDRTIVPLISITDWDFHWQDVYTYTRPVPLPAGTVVEMEYRYDNSSANRRNPHKPPRRVTFGQTSASEMGSMWLQVVPRRRADLAVLERDFAPKILRDDIAGNEKWLEVEPANAQLRAELAACYLEANRWEDALAQLKEAARLDSTAGRHYDVGRVLLLRQQYDAAETSFRSALALRPDFGEAVYGLALVRHSQRRLDEAIDLYVKALRGDASSAAGYYNLGRAHTERGDLDSAIRSFERAIEIDPMDADPQHGLARVLAMRNRVAEAMYRYRQTLEIDPDRVGAMLDLAWIIATSAEVELRVPAQAVRLAERAVSLTERRNATALDTLAAAYASAKQMNRAIATADEAVQVALQNGESDLAEQIRARLEKYRREPAIR